MESHHGVGRDVERERERQQEIQTESERVSESERERVRERVRERDLRKELVAHSHEISTVSRKCQDQLKQRNKGLAKRARRDRV